MTARAMLSEAEIQDGLVSLATSARGLAEGVLLDAEDTGLDVYQAARLAATASRLVQQAQALQGWADAYRDAVLARTGSPDDETPLQADASCA